MLKYVPVHPLRCKIGMRNGKLYPLWGCAIPVHGAQNQGAQWLRGRVVLQLLEVCMCHTDCWPPLAPFSSLARPHPYPPSCLVVLTWKVVPACFSYDINLKLYLHPTCRLPFGTVCATARVILWVLCISLDLPAFRNRTVVSVSTDEGGRPDMHACNNASERCVDCIFPCTRILLLRVLWGLGETQIARVVLWLCFPTLKYELSADSWYNCTIKNFY